MAIISEDILNELKHNNYEFIEIIGVEVDGNSSRIICKCECGNIFKKKLHQMKNLSVHCGCKKSFLLSRGVRNKISNDPTFLKRRGESYSKWCKDHPEEVAAQGKRHSEKLLSDPEKLAEQGKRHSQWYKDNPDKAKEKARKNSQWYKDNPDKVKERSIKYSETVNSDSEYFLKRSKSYSETYKKFRCEKFKDFHADYIHPDDLQLIINGDIDSHGYVRSKCPECGKYYSHLFSSFIDMKTGSLIRNRPPLCKSCYSGMTSSQYEIELRNFISQLGYDYITNDRDVLKGHELDIYIPSKQIAIEFNGDYWHNANRQGKYAHYEKFIDCYNKGIALVSIFESAWNNIGDKIKNYIVDLLNNKVNNLSYDKPGYMNNNYPLPLPDILSSNIKPNLSVEDFYTVYKYTVYTCGYSEVVSTEEFT